eukprot:768416-Hanusia_phi.AAC.6
MFFSSAVRRDVQVKVILGGSKTFKEGELEEQEEQEEQEDASRQPKQRSHVRTVTISGREVKHLRPDERNIACLMQTVRISALSSSSPPC